MIVIVLSIPLNGFPGFRGSGDEPHLPTVSFNSIEWIPAGSSNCANHVLSLSFNSNEWILAPPMPPTEMPPPQPPFNSIEWILDVSSLTVTVTPTDFQFH